MLAENAMLGGHKDGHVDECYGVLDCIDACDKADANPKKYRAECDAAKAQLNKVAPRPQPSQDQLDANLAQQPAQLGPGAFPSEEPLSPAGLFARAAASVWSFVLGICRVVDSRSTLAGW
jgi:hypothetical protein